MRRLIHLLCLILGTGFAAAQDGFQQLEDLLERGLYNSAALVSGPALVEANPTDRRAWELYARALLLMGDAEQARTALDQMLSLGPDSPQTVSEKHLAGLVLAAEDDLQAALPLLAQATADSGMYRYAMDWGRVAWMAADLDQAEQAYLQAAATVQGQREPWPWLDLGRIRLSQDRLAEAEEAFERAIAVYEAFDTGASLPSPAYVESFFRLGQLEERRFELTGDPVHLELARFNYGNALVGDPNYGPALTALARLDGAVR